MLRFITLFSLFLVGVMSSAIHAEETDYNSLPLPELTQKAKAGDARAQFALGAMYRDGFRVQQDDQQAVDWLRKAAEQGVMQAQFNLGLIYYKGRGVPEDVVLSYVFFSLAAAHGDDRLLVNRNLAVKRMTVEQLKEGEEIVNHWQPGKPLPLQSKTGVIK